MFPTSVVYSRRHREIFLAIVLTSAQCSIECSFNSLHKTIDRRTSNKKSIVRMRACARLRLRCQVPFRWDIEEGRLTRVDSQYFLRSRLFTR